MKDLDCGQNSACTKIISINNINICVMEPRFTLHVNKRTKGLKTTLQIPDIYSEWVDTISVWVAEYIVPDIWSLFLNVVCFKVYMHNMWPVCMIFPMISLHDLFAFSISLAYWKGHQMCCETLFEPKKPGTNLHWKRQNGVCTLKPLNKICILLTRINVTRSL